MPFPAIDPIAIEIGPLAIRWYALAYIAGLLGGWWYVRWLVQHSPKPMSVAQVDDFLIWATLGVVIGGRLGYVLFYKPVYYLGNPLEIFMVWKGGMSFHGGLLGVVAAIVAFCRSHKLNILAVGDVISVVAPLGLFFGRLANFINGELFGRPAPDVPWAMVFPHGGPVPRHPSQLYEAALEGLVLLIIMHLLWRSEFLRRRPGFLFGAFLAGYSLARIVAEVYREPDAHLGFIAGGVTMGQILSVPMLLAGIVIMAIARKRTA